MAELEHKTFRFYLSGSIKKGDNDTRPAEYFWTDEDESYLAQHCKFSAEFLHPARPKIDRQDELNNLGCDLYLITISDAVIVDLRHRKGIGVGAELMLADRIGIPVIGLIPEKSHYKRPALTNVSGQDLREWTHPFALGLCDRHCQSLGEVAETLNKASDAGDFSRIYSEKSHCAIARFSAKNRELANSLAR